MSLEIEAMKIDAETIRLAEIEKLTLKIVSKCEHWGCFDTEDPPYEWSEGDKRQFQESIHKDINQWLKELPWIAK